MQALVQDIVQEGETAVLTFEPSAYTGTLQSREAPRRVADNPDQYRLGSRAWLEGKAGSDWLDALRSRYRWIVLFIPPADATLGKDLQISAASDCDETMVLVNTGTTPQHATRALLDRLETVTRPMRG